jgi:hypothetical protein
VEERAGGGDVLLQVKFSSVHQLVSSARQEEYNEGEWYVAGVRFTEYVRYPHKPGNLIMKFTKRTKLLACLSHLITLPIVGYFDPMLGTSHSFHGSANVKSRVSAHILAYPSKFPAQPRIIGQLESAHVASIHTTPTRDATRLRHQACRLSWQLCGAGPGMAERSRRQVEQ